MEAKTDEYQEQQPVSFDTFKEKPQRKRRARTEKQYASAVRNAEKARRSLAAKRAGGLTRSQLALAAGGEAGGGSGVRGLVAVVGAVLDDPRTGPALRVLGAIILQHAKDVMGC